MSKRKIIEIDQEKCNGCGECISNCPEGAIQIIDGKARLVGDLLCDGLGACIGHCPEGAIIIVEREAEKYDERKVIENILKQGVNVVKAHLEHLKAHGQCEYMKEAMSFLKEKGVNISTSNEGHSHTSEHDHGFSSCPGAKAMDFRSSHKDNHHGTDPMSSKLEEDKKGEGEGKSQLRHWPIQMHLISPQASYYKGADVLLSADCVSYALGDFHDSFLKGKSLAIACPKLDEGQDVYVEKIKSLFEDAHINTLTVMIMQVPCCRGLLALVERALQLSKRKVPVKCIVVGIQGEIQKEEWINAT